MSRQRRRLTIRVGDGEETVIFRDEAKALAATAPPRRTWLVTVHDPVGHMIAVLATSPDRRAALVYTGEHPAFVLGEDGLRVAFVDRHAEPVRGDAVGSPRPSFPVYCPQCGTEHDLAAAGLRAQRDHPGVQPGRPQRLTLP